MMQDMKKSNGFQMSRVALFLNGQTPSLIPDLEQFEQIFCTDGAFLYLKALNITPDVVSGDFDSISSNEIPKEIEVVYTPDQNYTDFEKALILIENRNFNEVYVYGSSGMEHDHFLGNLSSGLKFKERLTIVFFDDFSYYFFTDKSIVLDGYKGRTISLYPFPVTKGIKTKGLKYPLESEDLDMTKRIGIRNQAVEDKVEIRYKEGELLLFIKLETP